MSENFILLHRLQQPIQVAILPPSSKSESNRALIIDALSGHACNLKNLSNARDTQTMIRLLSSDEFVLDVLDAGTTMRFLTAYCAVCGREAELTGTARMRERPIKLLVDALNSLGCNVSYKENEGYPPLIIRKPNIREQNNYCKIRGDVSSQYITALLMVAPVLPNGLVLELEGKIGSKPYIEMTLRLMHHFGIKYNWEGNIITIPHQSYVGAEYFVESDWSAASYWYSIAALAPESRIELIGYKPSSLQGDRVIVDIGHYIGVNTTFTENGLLLQKKAPVSSFEWDFTHCPDLAQTIAVVCAAQGIECTMHGLESLRIKETDRIAALQNELKKFNIEMIEIEKDHTYKVCKGHINVSNQMVHTYHDHRMAMAFAPLALLGDICIHDPEVVNKSYPHFWNDLSKSGFMVSYNK
ncbi:MAG: 3-phosphoshikimate 1-carboxyvinyltransferase [Cytophagaceae bacterium]|nr:3-phosphoshikimate 1-carboxyvinyltransferase [Cytophagaceae bacterium]MDW8456256.1 3-phosphoshikimate 1-carboxyvinyltransferase [Cytophagaceae bacterium]